MTTYLINFITTNRGWPLDTGLWDERNDYGLFLRLGNEEDNHFLKPENPYDMI